MTYDYWHHWNCIEIEQHESIFREDMINYLKTLNFKKVLEIGSGQGFVSRVLKENFEIHLTGIDIAVENDYLDEFIRGDLTEIDFDSYDLIVARFVLLHIKPEHIEKLVKKIEESCNHFCIIDIDPLHPKPMAPHNFIHKFNWKSKRLTDDNVMFYR